MDSAGLRAVFTAVLYFLLLDKTFSADDPSHHCNRPCEGSASRLCEYNFTVENYLTLSKACYSCPFTPSDCFRPHCVTANGRQRSIITINRQIPGPAIQVCRGDTVRVHVKNALQDGSATSIHWHGLVQTNTCYMDGVPLLTQCAVSPEETFIYQFIADNAGTHWYHSHIGLQSGEGAFGPFIVREPQDPSGLLYDEDLSEHVMVLTDWNDMDTTHRYMEEMHHLWDVKMGIGVIVNGRGQKYAVTDPFNVTGLPTAPPPTKLPLEVFNVTQNRRYRMRVIAATARCHVRVMIDGHHMVVIAMDGGNMEPVTVGSFMIHPGERVDFVLQASASPGSYWIKIEGHGDCKRAHEGNGVAILRYAGYDGNPMPAGDPANFTQEDTILNPTPSDRLPNRAVTQAQFRNGQEQEDDEEEEVDVQHYIDLRYLANDNSFYNHPVYYPNPSRAGHITPTLNNITLSLPPAPLLTQYQDIMSKGYCNSTIGTNGATSGTNGTTNDTNGATSGTLDTQTNCQTELCRCTHMLDVKLGQVVELFLMSHANDPHPMHLHGYTYRIVGGGMFSETIDDFKQISVEEVITRDKAGRYPRNLRNAKHSDNAVVHGKGGYLIIRFKADNPGIWIFHCHNDGHLLQGMGMIIKVGEPDQFPKAPNNSPVCGGSVIYPHGYNTCKQETSAAARAHAYTQSRAMMVVFSCIFVFLLNFHI